MGLQTGQIVDGKYRIIRELGSGAMGAVYEGENLRIKRRVAIKVLLPSVADRGDVVQRFEREAQAAGRIGSDHIVEVLDLGTLADGGFYMVMEFLEGETLGARIKRSGRLDGRAIAPLAQQLLMGLEMAHEASVIHRDLKPENVFLCREHAGQKDFVKILDFGVSKFNPLNDEEGMSMTRTGTVVGTPFYMAPEQAKGARDIDSRSDLYSVGVILYEAVTGQVPFHAGTFNELIFKIVLEPPPPPEQFAPDLDPGFSRILRKAMSRDRGERYQKANEFRDALYIWLHTGRSAKKEETLPAPPIGDDVDWAAEKRTMMLDDGPANMGTQIMAPGSDRALDGGGTALMSPEEAKTTLMNPDDDDYAATVTKQVPSKRPPPPPSKRAPSKRAPPPPKKNAPTPPPPAAGVQAPAAVSAAAMAPAAVPHAAAPAGAPAVPQQGGSGLGYGAPTPVSRSAPMSEWPVGVPRKKSPMMPIILGSAIALAAGGAAAVFLVPWSSPAPAAELVEETDDDESEATDDDSTDEADPPLAPTIAHDASNPPDNPSAGSAAPAPAPQPNTEPDPSAARPTAAPPPAPVAPPPPPRVPPPATRRPPPKPQPPPDPPPPPPRTGGRKVETQL